MNQQNGTKDLPDGDSHAKAHRRRSALVLTLLTCLVSFLTACAGSGNIPVPENLTSIRHTGFIINENHTFDNYFVTFPRADGTTTRLLSTGQCIPLSPMPVSYHVAMHCNSRAFNRPLINTP